MLICHIVFSLSLLYQLSFSWHEYLRHICTGFVAFCSEDWYEHNNQIATQVFYQSQSVLFLYIISLAFNDATGSLFSTWAVSNGLHKSLCKTIDFWIFSTTCGLMPAHFKYRCMIWQTEPFHGGPISVTKISG